MSGQGSDGSPPLRGLQERFVQEYLVDLNATRAAIRAGYSPKSAYSAGPRLLRLPGVRAAVEAAMAERRQRVRVSQDRVVTELARLAFSDIRDFAAWDGEGVRLRDSGELPPGGTACIAEIVQTPGREGRALRLKLHGKTRALEALARHLGLFDREEDRPGGAVFRVVTRVPEPDWDGEPECAETTEAGGPDCRALPPGGTRPPEAS